MHTMWLARKTILKSVLKHLIRACVVLVLAGGILFLFYNEYLSGRGGREYSGVVVDKWVAISETQQGSYLIPVILVKTDSGELIKARVNSETYERLRISERVRNDSAGLRTEQTIDSFKDSIK